MTYKRPSHEIAIAAAQNIEAENYWLNRFAGKPVKSCFPPNYRKRAKNARTMDVVESALPPRLFSRLTELTKNSDVRLFITLTAGLVLLLDKYTYHNHKDITVGTSIYRQKKEVDFINTVLPLKNRVNGDITVKEFLMQMGGIIAGANKHQNYPMEKLLYLLDMTSSGQEDFPLFDAAVLLKNLHDRKYLRHINLNIIFNFERTDKGILLNVEYNSLLYMKSAIEKIIAHFINLSTNAVYNVDLAVSRIDALSGAEKKKILFDFNDTGADFSRHQTMHRLFEEQVARTPGCIAVTAQSTGDHRLSYKELNERANRLAGELRKKGVKPNCFAAVVMDRSIEMVVAVLGILKAGGAYVPLEPHLPGARIITCLSSLKAEWLLTNHSQLNKIREIKERLPGLKHIFCLDRPGEAFDGHPGEKENPGPAASAEDIAYVIFTSGTTGIPKGVVEQHRPVVNIIQWVNRTFHINGSDRLLFVASLSFDLSVYDIFGILAAGASLRVVGNHELKSPDGLLDIIFEEEITFWDSAPAALQQLIPYIRELKDSPRYKDKGRLRLVFLSGDWIPVAMPGILKGVFEGVRVIALGGATEATIWSNFYAVERVDPDWKSIPYGKPIQNAAYYILDQSLNPCPIGVPGDLYIGGECLAAGYINDIRLTTKKFTDNPFVEGEKMYRTGDLARWFPDGNMEFLGRQDNQVKIRGFRIELGEIESRLLAHDEIESAVVSAKERDGDKYLCAYYQANDEVPPAQLSDYLAKTLPEYMIPPYFIKLDRIPVTANGKLDRKALPEPYFGPGTEAYLAPRNTVEEKIAAIWSDVLRVKKEKISINSDFFELGGHSLNATVMIAKIHKELKVRLPLAEVFTNPTINTLAMYIDGASQEKFTAIRPVEEREYYRLSPAQHRLYVLQRMEPGATAYNMPEAVVMEREVEREKLADTFKKLIRRHESFRTSFVVIEGKPMQRIHKEVAFEVEYYNGTGRDTDFIKPFDLTRPPLLRVKLIRTGKQHCIMVTDMHHIISDGYSHQVLIKDFVSLYMGSRLPGPQFRYKDYSEWRQSTAVKESCRQQQEYWGRELAGEIPVLNLPYDYPRPAVQSFEGRLVDFQPGEDTAAALKRIAVEEGVTPFMLILTLFYILLAKITGQEIVIVGTDAAGRNHADLENIIGMFVNTLSLKNFPRAEKTSGQFLAEVKERVLEAFDNQDYQFENLVEQAAVRRDVSRNPIFDVMFSFFDMEAGAEVEAVKITQKEKDGLKIKPYSFANRTAKFDLTLNAAAAPGQVLFSFEYCTKLFKEETIQRFISYFKRIISAVIADGNREIARIEIISPEEKKQVLLEFNNTGTAIEKDGNYPRLFGEQALKTPGKIAAVHRDRHITYSELAETSGRFACLLSEHGITTDTFAALYLNRGITMLVSIIAVFKAGGAYLPIERNFPRARVEYMLEDSEAPVVIAEDDINVPGKIAVLCPGREGEPAQGIKTPRPPGHPDNLAYLIYTSGTTGKPKGVMIHRLGMINHLYAKINHLGITAQDIVAQTASACFDISVWQFLAAPLTGGTTFIIDKETVLEPREFLRVLQQGRATILESVPSLMTAFLEAAAREPGKTLETLRWMIPTGEPLGISLVKEWYRLYPGIKLLNAYGPTEASDDVTHYIVDDIPGGTLPPVPIGKPLQNLHIYILDKHLSLCPVGIRGEICAAGLGVGKGYWKDAAKTRKAFIPNPFLNDIGNGDYATLYKTGDIGYFRPDGTVVCLGRADDQVKIRGNRIQLGEIESQLANHSEVKQAVVVTGESGESGKYLCAYIVSTGAADTQGLRGYLSGLLPDYMIPSYFIRVEEIPLTPNGKIDRNALPGPGPVTGTTGEQYVPPRDKIEKRLVETWQEVLGLKRIGITDNFFEVGGDSIKAIQVAARLKKYRLDLKINDLFLHPIIKDLGKTVKETTRIIHQGTAVGDVELTPVQAWFFENDFTHPHHYNLSVMLYNRQGFDETTIEKLFSKIVRHHDALRMVYETRDRGNKIYQRNRDTGGRLFGLEVIPFVEGTPHVEKEIEKEAGRIQASIDLQKGPLLKLGLFKTPEGDHLLIALHHLVTDGISWRILLEDIHTGYNQLTRGAEIQFQEKTDSFLYWAQTLKEYAGRTGRGVLPELPYWKNIEKTRITPLPRDHRIAGEMKKHKYIRYVNFHLDEEPTKNLLQKVNRAYNTEINDILLTALGLAVKEWADIEKLLINLEGHGRDALIENADIDIGRTVGWFTVEYPVLLDMDKSRDLSYQIKSVKETLRAIPNKGIGYGILKYLTPPEKKGNCRFEIEPEIAFNYMGQFGQEQGYENNNAANGNNNAGHIQMSPLGPGAGISPEMEEKFAIDVNGMITAGKLDLSLAYNKCEYDKTTMEKLAAAYRSHLLNIIRHCVAREGKEFTPGDFEYSDMDLEEFEELKSELAEIA